jgi:hypothetical protein
MVPVANSSTITARIATTIAIAVVPPPPPPELITVGPSAILYLLFSFKKSMRPKATEQKNGGGYYLASQTLLSWGSLPTKSARNQSEITDDGGFGSFEGRLVNDCHIRAVLSEAGRRSSWSLHTGFDARLVVGGTCRQHDGLVSRSGQSTNSWPDRNVAKTSSHGLPLSGIDDFAPISTGGGTVSLDSGCCSSTQEIMK